MSNVLLRDRDYTFIVAKSKRAAAENLPVITRRWLSAQDAIVALAKQCEGFDGDGITVYINPASSGNSELFQRYDHLRSHELDQVFAENIPLDSLNLNTVLQMALDDYFERKTAKRTKVNGEIVLVVTDGEPQDRRAIVKTIVNATQRMDVDEELGIGFIQIGDDALARGFLTVLDDDLRVAGAKFDIVHTRLLSDIESSSLAAFLVETITD
ncbi:MAG: hypothetical protein NZ772_05960 [Cyanobacteria bacterium]|nr:hypothetical protein [Cyanobacteriota bacterium]MDW8201061.1 hypothetical protein [Cyanobacteriota bacterium SKYGB_h_bin112]